MSRTCAGSWSALAPASPGSAPTCCGSRGWTGSAAASTPSAPTTSRWPASPPWPPSPGASWWSRTWPRTTCGRSRSASTASGSPGSWTATACESPATSPLRSRTTQARRTVLIFEKMFENRLVFVDKLVGMGARIIVCDPHRVVVNGPTQLYGERLESPDIRAGMALLLAALAADGESVIGNVGQIDRGYERIDERLRGLGANIERTG